MTTKNDPSTRHATCPQCGTPFIRAVYGPTICTDGSATESGSIGSERPDKAQNGDDLVAAAKSPPSSAKWFPFCSERCKLLDLSGWLQERYRISSTASSPVGQSSSESDDSADRD